MAFEKPPREPTKIRVEIIIHSDGDYGRDTLESRMVDVRIESLKSEFERNDIPVKVIRKDVERK